MVDKRAAQHRPVPADLLEHTSARPTESVGEIDRLQNPVLHLEGTGIVHSHRAQLPTIQLREVRIGHHHVGHVGQQTTVDLQYVAGRRTATDGDVIAKEIPSRAGIDGDAIAGRTGTDDQIATPNAGIGHRHLVVAGAIGAYRDQAVGNNTAHGTTMNNI